MIETANISWVKGQATCPDPGWPELTNKAKMNRFRVLSLCMVLVSASMSAARDYTFTLKLGAGRTECFYDYIHDGAFLEIEYQVYVHRDYSYPF